MGGRTPCRQFMTGGFRGRTTLDRQWKGYFFSSPFCAARAAAHLTSGAIVHVALLARGVATLDRLGSPPVSGFRTVLKKSPKGFHPLPAASCGIERANSLSAHAFVRSMTRTQRHSRRLVRN